MLSCHTRSGGGGGGEALTRAPSSPTGGRAARDSPQARPSPAGRSHGAVLRLRAAATANSLPRPAPAPRPGSCRGREMEFRSRRRRRRCSVAGEPEGGAAPSGGGHVRAAQGPVGCRCSPVPLLPLSRVRTHRGCLVSERLLTAPACCFSR